MEHLTHGWEPDLDEGDSLLRRFVLASGQRSMDLAARAGGRTKSTPAVTMADAASPVVFDNIAVLLQPPTYIDLDGTLEAVLSSSSRPPPYCSPRGPRRTSRASASS